MRAGRVVAAHDAVALGTADWPPTPMQEAGVDMLCWTLVAVAAVWILLRWLLPAPMDLPPQCLSDDVAAEDVDVTATLAAQLDAPRVEGNAVRLLVNGDRIFPPMLEAIEGARDTVNLLTYIWWRGDIACRFAEALASAAERGVEVRVLLDAYGAHRIDPALVERMQGAGCRLAWYHPVRWRALRRLNHRTHRKVLVVDGRTAFTGGVGIAAEWTGDAQDAAHFRDNHFRLRGPIVHYLQGAFAENWRQAAREVLSGERMFPPLGPCGDAQIVSINAGAGVRFSGIPLTYWLLFRCARERVTVATPYFAPDPSLHLGLKTAARNGVDVTLLVPGEHNDSRLLRLASRSYYAGLIEAGVKVFEFTPTLLHTKTVLVDGTWALIGSSNFDSRSLRLNYETALAVFDRDLAAALAEATQRDLERSEPVTRETLAAWPAWRRAACWAARALRREL